MLTGLPAWLAEGQQAIETARYREAAEAFARAAAALPTEWALHQMVANAWRLAGDVVHERDALRTAFLAGPPADIEELFALGTALVETGAPREARACFEAVVAKRPRDPGALGALASALRANGDPAAAWPLVQRALTLTQKMPALLLTAAQVRHALGDTAGARQWLQKADKIRPGHPLQQIQRAFSFLLEQPCTAGWAAFESRGLPATPPGVRDWHGEPLGGSTIAVLMEQGLGDLFHFARYVRRLEARGPSRVIVECPPSTVSLLRTSGIDVVPTGQLPLTDWSVPLLSLPHRLESNTDTASELVPYLLPNGDRAERSKRVRGMAGGATTPRVGVVSKGNPAFLSTVLRDLDPSGLKALTDRNGVEWVWLQFGDSLPEYLDHNRVTVAHMSHDWLATAAILEGLDLLISVDTAMAHLAGAMGIPTIVLLPYSPDWRWGLNGDRCAWYPSVRLARQPEPNDWLGAVAVAHAFIEDLRGADE